MCSPVSRDYRDPENAGVTVSQVQAGSRGHTLTGLAEEKSNKGSVYRGGGRVSGNPGHQATA